jgi:hypothetical protein
MIENEDSVVTSLNELRKLKHERITRQSQSRPHGSAARAVALAEDPAADQLTPPPSVAHAMLGAQLTSGRNGGGASVSTNPDAFAQAAAYSSYQAPPVIQTKTSYKAAVVMSVLLAGAAAAGYVKLQNDTQATLAAKDASIRQAEETRNRAVEQASKADMTSKASLRQCEEKLSKATMAAVAPSAAAPAPALAVEKKAEKPAPASKVASRSASHHSAAAVRPARRTTAQAEPAAPKESAVPTIAKKKKVDNDPLAGLGKL